MARRGVSHWIHACAAQGGDVPSFSLFLGRTASMVGSGLAAIECSGTFRLSRVFAGFRHGFTRSLSRVFWFWFGFVLRVFCPRAGKWKHSLSRFCPVLSTLPRARRLVAPSWRQP